MSSSELSEAIDHPPNILVVDDEPDVKALFTLQFRKEIRTGAIKFSFAENGLVALERLEADPSFDLVLSDINMPEMDGLSLLKRIRTHHPLIQVVMVTAYGDLENIRAAMNAGSFDFLNKPFSMGDLKVTIGNALEHARSLRAFESAKAQREEAQRILVTQLKRMDQLKDEFLTHTSHELHTPLNGMIELAQALISGNAGPLNEKATGDLQQMVNAGQRLRHLVDDILDFAKMRREDEAVELVPCDFGAIVENVLSLSRPLLRGKDVTLAAEMPHKLPPVLGNEDRLFHLLHNLVGNAVKFTESGHIRVRVGKTGDHLSVSVEDTGCGIPTSKQAHIFNSFEQVESSQATTQGGTGLGLAIAKQLVLLHGGEIVMDSREGEGSTFSFTLRLAGRQEAALPPEKPSPQAFPVTPVLNAPEFSGVPTLPAEPDSWMVLAVDDEPVNLQVLVNQLSLKKVAVDPASDGFQALARLQEKPYDLVILDVMMPGMSGLEVCRKIRETMTMSDLPVLMLTARNRPEDVVAGMEAGANDYLAKPFDSAELFARAKNLVTLRKAVLHGLDQARALGAERKQREQLEYLRQFNRDLSSTLELREVLHRFLQRMNDCAPHDLAFFCLDIHETFQVVAERGVMPYDVPTKELLHKTCSQWSEILKPKNEPMPLRFNDANEALPDGIAKTLEGSWLGVPMINRGKMVGTLFMFRRNAAHFPEQEIQLGFTFVEQACLAIENARLFEQVRHLAMTDSLTDLYNRRFFFTEGQMAVDRAQRFNNPLSLLMLDIDHFKKVNDEHSHAVGDQVLVLLAKTIKTQCRQADIAGRYGGEEIAILMPQTDARAAAEVAERLRKAISDTPAPIADKGELKVTVSIGVATFSPGDKSLDDLLGRADKALYEAKDSGRNRVVSAIQPSEDSD